MPVTPVSFSRDVAARKHALGTVNVLKLVLDVHIFVHAREVAQTIGRMI